MVIADRPTVGQRPGRTLAAVAAEFRTQLAHHSVSQKGELGNFRIARQPPVRLFLRFFFQVLEPVWHYIDLVFGAGDVGLPHRYQASIRSDRVTRRNLLVLEQ